MEKAWKNRDRRRGDTKEVEKIVKGLKTGASGLSMVKGRALVTRISKRFEFCHQNSLIERVVGCALGAPHIRPRIVDEKRNIRVKLAWDRRALSRNGPRFLAASCRHAYG
jgi:hypothetical protein